MNTTSSRDAECRWWAFQTRMDALAARRHAVRVAESANDPQAGTLRDAVARAVTRALRGLTETTAADAQFQRLAPPADDPPVEPAKPLHQMNSQELRARSREYWSQRGEALGSPSWRGLE
ncbi:hypothetical protein ACFOSC_26570 [Streptantibioticus rubrisoli]|uniref:Uncharacterized protein n=1 Tax=Streptantibioticus rubrisoli TaxID=1387313 RepID=A0ABT1PEV1_9ACTN|nr:hypothetical protein [Streptantibioticus rubrisoli]MCQ4043859.1 hypothetical protein [Streptantibioticus rubrisoli]